MLDISVTLFGITGAVVKDVQAPNVLDISVTLFGITGAVVKDVQLANVLDISVTLFGITGAVVNDLQSENVYDKFITDLFAMFSNIVPYDVLALFITRTPHPFCDEDAFHFEPL